MKNPWVVIGIICVVLFGGAIWYSGKAAEENNEGVVFTPHIKGNTDAAVTLVEYSDFQCPACGAFQPALTAVLDEYGDQISFEYKHFPLYTIHPHAIAAAVAAEAAGQQGKFFEFHDLLFANQQEWAGASVPTSFFVQYAEELGLDVPTFRRHLASNMIEQQVRDGFNEARDLGLTGTPTFFLNGERMVIETYEGFRDQVAAAVDPASIGSTTPAANVQFGL